MAAGFTRNFYNALTATQLGAYVGNNTTPPTDYTPPIRLRLPNGNYNNLDLENTSYTNPSAKYFTPLRMGKDAFGLMTGLMSWTGTGPFSFGFGSGSAAFDYDDYKLDTLITSGLTLGDVYGAVSEQSTLIGSDHYESEKSYTITNTSASNITVTEFGIFATNLGSSNPALMYRDVFDDPIVLAPSESIVVFFKRSGEIYNYVPY